MKFFRFWVPVIIWMTVIFFFSARSRIEVSANGVVNFLFFKTLHVLEYALLYLLLFRAFKNTKPKESSGFWYVASLIITVVYAVSDEIHQTIVPTREGRLRDVIIDATGALFTWWSIRKLLPGIPHKLRRWARDWQLL